MQKAIEQAINDGCHCRAGIHYQNRILEYRISLDKVRELENIADVGAPMPVTDIR